MTLSVGMGCPNEKRWITVEPSFETLQKQTF